MSMDWRHALIAAGLLVVGYWAGKKYPALLPIGSAAA